MGYIIILSTVHSGCPKQSCITEILGDEVLEWNGRLLQGATFEEVYNIILESKPEPQVELVVSRPIG